MYLTIFPRLWGSNWLYINIGLYISLAEHQAITWTSDDVAYTCYTVPWYGTWIKGNLMSLLHCVCYQLHVFMLWNIWNIVHKKKSGSLLQIWQYFWYRCRMPDFLVNLETSLDSSDGHLGRCLVITATNQNGQNRNGHKPKRPQTEMATNWNGHKPERPQTETATNRNGLKPKRPQTETATDPNGLKPKRPQTEWANHLT